jgi:autotransporter-associated beta strand protein
MLSKFTLRHGLSWLLVACLVLASLSQAQQPEHRMYGKGNPFTVEQLPAGKLKEQLQELSPQARGKAMQWLHGLQFGEADAAHHLRVDHNGGVFITCPGRGGCKRKECGHEHGEPAVNDEAVAEEPPIAGVLEATTSPVSEVEQAPEVAAASVSIDSPPAYNSKSDAPYHIYLDFNGAYVSGKDWRETDGTTTWSEWDCHPWSSDGDRATFTDVEQTYIRLMWERVAEDYRPFNVNVTTDTSTQTTIAETTVELVLALAWDANGVTAGQTNGAGAWLGSNLWWDGVANTDWVSGSDAIFGGAATSGGSVTLASPTTANTIIINQHTGTYTLGSSGQALTLNGGIDKTSSSGALNIVSPVVLGADQVWNHEANGDITVTGAISGSGGITKTGSGKLIFKAGQDAHSYSGNTVVNGGILQLGTTWSNANNIPGGLTGASGSAQSNLEINGGTVTISYYMTRSLGTAPGQIQITGERSGLSNRQGDASSGNWRVGGDANYEIVWGTAAFNPSTFVLQDANANVGAATFTIDNLIDLNGATRTIEVGATTGKIEGVVRNSISTAGLIKTGAGTLVLGSAPTYNGNTTVAAGTLQLNGANSNNEASTVAIASGATLNLNFAGTDTVNKLFVGGSGMAAGVYKAVGSAASGTELSQLSGIGTLTVLTTASVYDSWSGGGLFSVPTTMGMGFPMVWLGYWVQAALPLRPTPCCRL